MSGSVIGEKVTLTGSPEPCVIPRPYQWERGTSMPKKYQRCTRTDSLCQHCGDR